MSGLMEEAATTMREYYVRLQEMADEWAPHTARKQFTPTDVLNFRWMHGTFGRGPAFPYRPWPLPNVHLGVSCMRQAEADERIPLLLQTPAALRWVSLEPLLGPVDLRPWLPPFACHPAMHTLDWVVCGAESGPGARPMNEDWVRVLRDQCMDSGVPLFYKQRVDHGEKISLPVLDGQVWAQVPVPGTDLNRATPALRR